MNSYKYGVFDAVLNQIYNSFSVHAPISTGEGFGIPTLEAAAVGKPNILTDYTTSAELLDYEREDQWFPRRLSQPNDLIYAKNGVLVPPESLVMGSMNVERGIANVNKVMEALQFLYDNPSEVKKMGINSLKFARKYDWNTIVPEWATLFEGLKHG